MLPECMFWTLSKKEKKIRAQLYSQCRRCLLVPCCVLAVWSRYERWFDLNIQPWQEGWIGSGGRLWGVTPSVRTHSSKSLPFLLHTHTHMHTHAHPPTHTPACTSTHAKHIKTTDALLLQEIWLRLSRCDLFLLPYTLEHIPTFVSPQFNFLFPSYLRRAGQTLYTAPLIVASWVLGKWTP